jgi:hypothetical protein
VRFDDPDRRLLEFASHHRVIVPGQVAWLLRAGEDAAQMRLRALRQAGLVRDARRAQWAPPGDQITGAGLRAIASPLRAPPRSYPGGYQHDVGLGWLWLEAQTGAFGSLRALHSERHMRSHDRRGDEGTDRFGVRLGGLGPGGQQRFHYPDLVLKTRSGHRVALELELTCKAPARREGILAGYAADPRIDAVVYLVDRPSVGRAIGRSARRMHSSDLIHVRSVSFPGTGATATTPQIRRRLLTAAKGADTARADR